MPKIVDPITRITCVACGLVAEGASPRVCVFCAERPRKVILWAWSVVDGFRLNQTTAGHQVAQTLDQADIATQERWYTFMAALTAGDARAVSTLDIIRIGMASDPPKPAGPFADLCRLYLVWQDSQNILAERYAWAEQVEYAMGELATPRGDQRVKLYDGTWGIVPPRTGEQRIPQGYPPSAIRCQSCYADMFYITTAKGGQMPIRLDTLVQRDGQWYGMPHFVDCPEGKGWSKR